MRKLKGPGSFQNEILTLKTIDTLQTMASNEAMMEQYFQGFEVMTEEELTDAGYYEILDEEGFDAFMNAMEADYEAQEF